MFKLAVGGVIFFLFFFVLHLNRIVRRRVRLK